MSDDLMSFVEDGEDTGELFGKFNFPQTLVTEKIIFVFDLLLSINDTHTDIHIGAVINLFKLFYNLKKKICAKPPEFDCLIYNSESIISSQINDVRDIEDALKKCQHVQYEGTESEPLKIDRVFDAIADLVELPDRDSCSKNLPPNWVYHVVWLFGRNLYVPSLENTNSLDYLMMTPYFALDILYLHDINLESNKALQIAKTLQSYNKNGQGYLLTKSRLLKDKALPLFAQFLGHPLIRLPQNKAEFDITKLGPKFDDNENSNKEVVENKES